MKTISLILCMAAAAHAGEALPNGTVLPDEWPPRIGRAAGKPPLETFSKPGDPPARPYLKTKLKGIPIDAGRQLFVDDFPIADTTLKCVWHQPLQQDMAAPRRPLAIPRDGRRRRMGSRRDPATRGRSRCSR